MAVRQDAPPAVAGLLTGAGDTPAPTSAPQTPASKPEANATDILRALLREQRAFQLEARQHWQAQQERHNTLSEELTRLRNAVAALRDHGRVTPAESAAQASETRQDRKAEMAAVKAATTVQNGGRWDRDAASAAYQNCLQAFHAPFDPTTGRVDWTRLSLTQADLYRLMAASDAPTTGQYQFQGNGKEIGERLADARRLWVARAMARGDAAEAKIAVMRWLAEPAPLEGPRISRYQALTSGAATMAALYPVDNLEKVRAVCPADPGVTVADAAAKAAAAYQARQAGGGAA